MSVWRRANRLVVSQAAIFRRTKNSGSSAGNPIHLRYS